ncbi:MAG: MFS transporter [Planctomycetota bacterium]
MLTKRQQLIRVILSGGIGSMLEWFDFAVYGYLASVIARVFFPTEDPVAGILSTFAVFTVGYLMRPVGAVFLGNIGDRLGRRSMLLWSILLMGIASTLIGLLPTYAQIGIFAPIGLVILRMIQGISVGGEYTGAMTYTAEISPQEHRGFVSSLASVGALMGLLLGSAVSWLLQSQLSDADMISWGWRLPFLAGFFIALAGILIREHLPETESFAENVEKSQSTPAFIAFTLHWRTLIQCGLIVAGANIVFYTAFVYFPEYAATLPGAKAGLSEGFNALVLLLQIVIIPIGGWLSDRYGRRRISLLFTWFLLLAIIPTFQLGTSGKLEDLIIAQIILSLPIGILFGIQGAMLVEITPAIPRCSIFSISYGLTMAIFAGTAPLLATWMIQKQEWRHGPSIYAAIFTVLSLVALYRLGETNTPTASITTPVRPNIDQTRPPSH